MNEEMDKKAFAVLRELIEKVGWTHDFDAHDYLSTRIRALEAELARINRISEDNFNKLQGWQSACERAEADLANAQKAKGHHD